MRVQGAITGEIKEQRGLGEASGGGILLRLLTWDGMCLRQDVPGWPGPNTVIGLGRRDDESGSVQNAQTETVATGSKINTNQRKL